MRSLNDAEKRLKALGLDDMPLVSVAAIPRPLPAGWFAEFRGARRDLLTQNVKEFKEELFMMDIPIEDIMAMFRGEKIPPNVSVKFKVPPIYGGPISTDNLFICRTASEGRLLDIFIAEQAGASELFCPNPTKSVYVASMASMNSPGGNATSDRLADVQAADIMSAIGGRD
jgi:hypothetical protein